MHGAGRVHGAPRVDGLTEWIDRKSGWAGTLDRQEEWIVGKRVEGAGRVKKQGQ